MGEEIELCLRSKNLTLNKNGNLQGQHIKYLPYAFTEQGIYMLMTVLKGELATKQSKALIRLFKGMKDYISSNINIIIFSDNKQNHLRLAEYNQFRTEYPNVLIDFKKNGNVFHDRYIIIDYGVKTEKVYHCGASSKDAGKKITTITESRDTKIYEFLIDSILNNNTLILS